MWLRHGVDVWHYECQTVGDLHDFIAEIVRKGESYDFNLSTQDSPITKTFRSPIELNEYLASIGMETLKI